VNGRHPGLGEQLYDEFCARAWALHVVVPEWVGPLEDRSMSRALEAAACRYAVDLRDGAATDVERLLYPTGAVPMSSHPWWRTPVGEVLSSKELVAHDARQRRVG
jgi:hypothetical protein